MEVAIESNKLENMSRNMRLFLQMICSLEYSNTTMKWYLGELMNRQELPSNERVLSFILSMSSLYEALRRFDELKPFIKSDIALLDKETTDEWVFLTSKEVNKLKQDLLALIRNQSGFHVFDEAIDQYINNPSRNQQQNEIVWKGDFEEKGSHFSPLAVKIISSISASVLNEYAESQLIAKIYRSLKNLSMSLSIIWFDAKLINL